MKILHVTPSYLPATRYGGPIYSVHALCRALVEYGHHVEVFTTDVDGPGRSPVQLQHPVDLDGVKVTYFPTGMGRRLYRSPAMATAMTLQIGTFDVVHIHSVFLWPTSAAATLARAGNVPYVMSPRGMLVTDLIRRKSHLLKLCWIELFERRNLANAAAIHATSQLEVDEIEALRLKARRYAVIPNGIDVPPFPGPELGKFRERDDVPTILFLGRINWKKGLDLLIPALAKVPGARLVVAGNDEETYVPQLRMLAREVGVADRVEFVGPVQGGAKWDLLRSADVFALTSYSENFGNAVLEAMACAVPVVVTPGVGLAKTVNAHGTGIVAEARPDSIAEALRRLLDDGELRLRSGDAGRKVAVEQYSWKRIAADMLDLYQDVAGSRTASPPSEPSAEKTGYAA